jgi:hypothetical protein
MPNQPVGAITIKREFVTNYKTRVKVRAKVSPATVSRIDQPTQASITTTPTVNSGLNNNINPE